MSYLKGEKMWTLLLLITFPFCAIADIQCPDRKTSCSEDKKCCKVDGGYDCCGKDAGIPRASMERLVFRNTSVLVGMHQLADGCSAATCEEGTCCTPEMCCPYSNAECCHSEVKCCPSGDKCCSGGCCDAEHDCCSAGCCLRGTSCCTHGCCPPGTTCCSDGCCFSGSKCCGSECCPREAVCCPTGGCCDAGRECCSGTCCHMGYRCCGAWCCKLSQRCGVESYVCINTGTICAPVTHTFVLLAMFCLLLKSYLA